MPRLPNLAERIYLAKRAAHLARLADRRMTRDLAERAVAAWEAEAALRGLSRESATYWDDAEVWIVGQRLVSSAA